MQHHHCSLNDTLILVMCDNTTPNINPHIAYTHKKHIYTVCESFRTDRQTTNPPP